MSSGRIVVVEDSTEMRALLEDELREKGYEVFSASSGDEALDVVARVSPEAVVTDLVMPGMKGNELLAELRTRYEDVPVIIMTAFGSIDSAVESMKGGAFHYLTKPFRIDQLVDTLENALSGLRWKRELEELREAASRGDQIPMVAENRAMRRALDLVRRAAPADSPVLIRGESGTGKELLALAVHAQSPRHSKPLVVVNCSAIPETLLESQLFGHRRGAFTDAREDRVGLFQAAEGGTLFLDEIGDMPFGLQAKLLRVLQQKEVHPLGAQAPVRIDVRIVAATHRDLEQLVEQGRFRQDLYYRLNVIAVHVPPLRERPEDIAPLIAHFLAKHGRRLERPGCTLSTEAMARLRGHSWPGNVRELENVIERALVLGRGQAIDVEDLPEPLVGRSGPRVESAEEVRMLVDVERDQIIKALRATRGNKTAAARFLGLDRKTLYRKIEAHGIEGF